MEGGPGRSLWNEHAGAPFIYLERHDMRENMKRKSRALFFTVPGWRALVEMAAIQIVVVGIWWLFFPTQVTDERTISSLAPDNVFTFLLLYSPLSVVWGALRWRKRKRGRRDQFIIECSLAVIVCLLFFVGANIFILSPIPSFSVLHFFRLELYDNTMSLFARLFIDIIIAVGSGGLFLFLRGVIRVIQAWNRLRKQHLSWALTHAFLMLPFAAICCISFMIVLVSLERFSSFPIYLIVSFFVFGFLTISVLFFLLPPIMLFSHFFVRRITQRIEMLASAASAMRLGNYSIRVPVQGEDEVARLQNDFNIMAAHLEHTLHELQQERDNVAQLLHERRELIASVSHELRTPVATMRGYLESTLANWQKEPSPTLHQDLEIISQQTIRLQGLINDLFMLARAEVGRLKLRCVPTSVDLLVQRIVDTLAPLTWRGSRVELVADVAPDLPQALVDEGRLEQILQNLLNNGVRHTPPGGIIAVSAQVDTAREQLVLQVKDTGEGIPADELSHIWDRFYRTRKSRNESSSGTGLGLAIVKEMTEAMGGTVEVESELGLGTCFTIRVPQAQPQEVSSITTVKLKAVEQQQR